MNVNDDCHLTPKERAEIYKRKAEMYKQKESGEVATLDDLKKELNIPEKEKNDAL